MRPPLLHAGSRLRVTQLQHGTFLIENERRLRKCSKMPIKTTTDVGTTPRQQKQIRFDAQSLPPETGERLVCPWLELPQTSDCDLLPPPLFEQKAIAAIVYLAHHCVLGVQRADNLPF